MYGSVLKIHAQKTALDRGIQNQAIRYGWSRTAYEQKK